MASINGRSISKEERIGKRAGLASSAEPYSIH